MVGLCCLTPLSTIFQLFWLENQCKITEMDYLTTRTGLSPIRRGLYTNTIQKLYLNSVHDKQYKYWAFETDNDKNKKSNSYGVQYIVIGRNQKLFLATLSWTGLKVTTLSGIILVRLGYGRVMLVIYYIKQRCFFLFIY
jgi:hypothetical protein